MEKDMQEEFEEFKEFAQSMGLSPKEYAVSLHKKNKAAKFILLENGYDFKSFVNTFHETLDELTLYKESDAKNESCAHYNLMKRVTNLLLTASQDPMMLAQLYEHDLKDSLFSSEYKAN